MALKERLGLGRGDLAGDFGLRIERVAEEAGARRQAVTQAGRLPPLMSSRQPSPMHLLGRPVFGLDQRASYGQEATQ